METKQVAFENNMSMKKIFLLLFLISSLSVQAQIQRRFYGFTFGLTQKDQVCNFFKEKGNRVRSIDENTIAVNNVKFGGFDWGVSYFLFYKNKFYQVYFLSSEHDMIKELLDEQWKLLKTKIYSKYSDYVVTSMSSDKEMLFSDFQTVMKLQYELYQGSWALSMVYYDGKIFDLKTSNEDDEL